MVEIQYKKPKEDLEVLLVNRINDLVVDQNAPKKIDSIIDNYIEKYLKKNEGKYSEVSGEGLVNLQIVSYY